ncbi:hypothetical protein EIP86_011046 [Pleurotus ostreatoroseus]|nr:hypothetical protein EIP86_011046 [Pleurotus ostreatoroseus]
MAAISCLVYTWDTETGKTKDMLMHCHEDSVASVTYSFDNRLIVSCSFDHTVHIWDTETRATIGKTKRLHSDWNPRCVAFSPDGLHLACGQEGSRIFLYDVNRLRNMLHEGLADEESRWLGSCDRMDESGWITSDDKTLLLWVPVEHRKSLRSCAQASIVTDLRNPLVPSSIDHSILFEFSGKDWVKVIKEIGD